MIRFSSLFPGVKIEMRQKGRQSPITLIYMTASFLVLLLPLTLWATAFLERTVLEVGFLLSGITLFAFVAFWAVSPKRLRLFLWASVWSGGILALAGVLVIAWPDAKLALIPQGFYDGLTSIGLNRVHPNLWSALLELLAPLTLSVILFVNRGDVKNRLSKRLIPILAACLTVVVLALTQSRGAWMGFSAALLLLLWLRGGWGVPTALGMLAVGMGSVLYVGPTYLLALLETSGSVGTLDGRLEIWSRAVMMIQDFPFTGIGMGSFAAVADVLYPFFLIGPDSIPQHAHNLFLQVGVDLGLPGLAAWLSIYLLTTWTTWKTYRIGKLNEDQLACSLGAGLLAGQLALGLHGMLDSPFWGISPVSLLVWMLWGLSIAAFKVYNR